MGTEDLAFWLSWCIEEFAAKNQIVNSDAASLFEKSGVLSYLSDNAEILHTQGKDYILGSIDDYLKSHKD